ncbi:MAG: OprO/OprP family phosphate-selective porin [Candidatus Methylomirabilis sp.]|nr:OprO/OprP family phosphate-selective porin [Deltaproteobacteria bacterium]
MKRKALLIVLAAMAGVAGAATAGAAEFAFGEETKGITLTQGESDLTIRVRLQPRFDFGDIITSTGNDSYATESDMYFRRARLEMGGNLVSKKIKYNVTFDADKWDKAGNNNKVSLKYAYVALTPDEAYSFMFGKEKLPYSREELISSSTLLFIERPASVDASRDVFGASNAYYQPKAAVYGKLLEGAIGYEVAVADGWQNGETIRTGATVYKAAPFLATRVEISPTGWVETKKQGSYLGKGQHITAGVSLAVQNDIDYATGGGEDRTLWGVDVSTHLQGLTASAEYISWEVDSSAFGETRPEGWFLQGGYFIEGLNIEPAARYEVFDENAKAADMKERTLTLGANWYGKGHSLKVQANWAHTRFESNASGALPNDKSRDILQIQGQLYF